MSIAVRWHRRADARGGESTSVVLDVGGPPSRRGGSMVDLTGDFAAIGPLDRAVLYIRGRLESVVGAP
ncbi:hypothetical protein AW168_17415 [Nocardia brasiliensis]|uniref:Uncharacterized protein n=1 Tax=Nocardia brasiliensis (strain ATCC 700358 / HUJEG-1) TaxID=1133849 RepID=K0EYJ3_NOCB7|nr:hypothetical protein O3I_019930 [Nocardia brasiliensis ATCC 700358]OCF89396.1 hypothetical protein AW168_17415 [Nocardia brasiliensis]